MTRKIFSILFALVLVLSFSLVTAVPALAWDVEDPCVADNDDFFAGGGLDTDTMPPTGGLSGPIDGLSLGGQTATPDGYNLYRDDVTDTGDLDVVWFITLTPDKIDLPNKNPASPPSPLATASTSNPREWYRLLC